MVIACADCGAVIDQKAEHDFWACPDCGAYLCGGCSGGHICVNDEEDSHASDDDKALV